MTIKQRNRHQPSRKSIASTLVRLNVPLTVKADTINTDKRTFTGLAATWQEDLGQDVIHKGAFKQTIKNWKASTEAMPLLNSHDHFDIFAALGQALAMKETDEGLEIDWEVIDGADGDRVLERIRPSARTGRAIIGKMSIGFVPTKFNFEQPPGTESFFDRVRHITEADLKEVSLVLFPMNPGAAIDATSVKSMLQMADDTDPAELDQITREGLRRLNSKIGNLLKKPQQKAEGDEEGSEEEEELTPLTPVDTSDSDDADTSTEEQDEEVDESTSTEEPTDTKDKQKQPKEEVKESKPTEYMFGEALKTRLRNTLLNSKISDTVN